MKLKSPRYSASQIIEKAKEFGASLAGITSVQALKKSPSHLMYGRFDENKTVGNRQGKLKPGEIAWPENAKSAIVIAVWHPEEKPELDWWKRGYNGGTAGNRMLISINAKLSLWLEKEKGIKTTQLPYHIGDGGIFLKDAAVMAGLGCIGKNNMLVTAEYGPRVRLRAMFTDELLPETGPVNFDPCKDCSIPCRNTCPQDAFANGAYTRALCNIQMETDRADAAAIKARVKIDKLLSPVKYCRACELSCPVGQ
jgi:epoxyqueuosine reductase